MLVMLLVLSVSLADASRHTSLERLLDSVGGSRAMQALLRAGRGCNRRQRFQAANGNRDMRLADVPALARRAVGADQMDLTVQLLSGHQVALRVHGADTIRDVKRALVGKVPGAPRVEAQRLICPKRADTLDDSFLVSEILSDGDTVKLVVVPQGSLEEGEDYQGLPMLPLQACETCQQMQRSCIWLQYATLAVFLVTTFIQKVIKPDRPDWPLPRWMEYCTQLAMLVAVITAAAVYKAHAIHAHGGGNLDVETLKYSKIAVFNMGMVIIAELFQAFRK